jgi:hypothetical protein
VAVIRVLVTAALIKIIHTGTVATMRAASPESMLVSPILSKPLPHTSSRTAMISVERSWRPVGRWAPRAWRGPTTANITAPAVRNRKPAMSSGGIVSTATAIPRYVEPQRIHTVINASHGSTGCRAVVTLASTRI